MTYYSITPAVSVLLAAVAWAGTASATTPFVYDSSGTVVRTGTGQCLLNGHGPRMGFDLVETCAAISPPPSPTPVAAAPEESEPAKPVSTVTYGATALFDFDKSNLRPDGKNALDKLVDDINSDATINRVIVVGHTCSIGTPEYNQGLSERRAATVKTYLISKGIAESKIESHGKGLTSPIASNDTREGRERNRRVEVELYADK